MLGLSMEQLAVTVWCKPRLGTSLGSSGSAWAGGSSCQGKHTTGVSWKAFSLFALLLGQKQAGGESSPAEWQDTDTGFCPLQWPSLYSLSSCYLSRS